MIESDAILSLLCQEHEARTRAEQEVAELREVATLQAKRLIELEPEPEEPEPEEPEPEEPE